MTTDAPAPTGFVCLQCWRVWTAEGQPETNPWELARAGLEIRFSAIQGPTTGPDGHCAVCDDGKNGPDNVTEDPARAGLIAKVREAIRVELLAQFDGGSWIDKEALNEREPWIQIDGTVDIQEMAESIVAVLGQS